MTITVWKTVCENRLWMQFWLSHRLFTFGVHKKAIYSIIFYSVVIDHAILVGFFFFVFFFFYNIMWSDNHNILWASHFKFIYILKYAAHACSRFYETHQLLRFARGSVHQLSPSRGMKSTTFIVDKKSLAGASCRLIESR